MLSEILKIQKQIAKLNVKLRHLDWKKRNKECLQELTKKYVGKYFRLDPQSEYDYGTKYTFVREINWTKSGFECVHDHLTLVNGDYVNFCVSSKRGGIEYDFGEEITKAEYTAAIKVALTIIG